MTGLLDLSDELILQICKYLDTCACFMLKQTCQRLDRICTERSLWKKANLSGMHMTSKYLGKLIRSSHPCMLHSHYLNIRGCRNVSGRSKLKLFTPYVLELLPRYMPNLEHLILRETVISAMQITVESFKVLPRLKTLAFINCDFINVSYSLANGSWFHKIDKMLPNLQTLKIVGNNFVKDYDIMAISKCSTLQELVLVNCVRIGIAMPYLALSFQLGFKSLQILDLRGTSLHDSDIPSVTQCRTLVEVYLGPMGRVKRQVANAENICNLVMSDPRRKDQQQQQVLVVNIGPNGPDWRQARDEELDSLGLQWVRLQNEQRQRMQEQLEDDHYLINQNGSLTKVQQGGSNGNAGAGTSGIKRKVSDDEDESGDESDSTLPSLKRTKADEPGSSSTEICKSHSVDAQTPLYVATKQHLGCVHEIDENFEPDKGLTDHALVNFYQKEFPLKRLHLAGCAITRRGLTPILESLKCLEEVNVMFTNVTQEDVELLRKDFPNCRFSDARPPAYKAGQCTIFCSS